MLCLQKTLSLDCRPLAFYHDFVLLISLSFTEFSTIWRKKVFKSNEELWWIKFDMLRLLRDKFKEILRTTFWTRLR